MPVFILGAGIVMDVKIVINSNGRFNRYCVSSLVVMDVAKRLIGFGQNGKHRWIRLILSVLLTIKS